MIVEKKKNLLLPLHIRIITLIAITFNNVLGEYYNLYVTSSLYDRLQHIFGTYALTLWGFFILQQLTQFKLTSIKFCITFLICLSLALGSIYEILEFLEDQLFNPAIKNQPSLLDTNLDLISDLIGGGVAVLHYLLSKGLKSLPYLIVQKNSTK
jgi:uncharacterized membrane protein YjdF